MHHAAIIELAPVLPTAQLYTSAGCLGAEKKKKFEQKKLKVEGKILTVTQGTIFIIILCCS